MKVAVIILNWNDHNCTQKSVLSVLESIDNLAAGYSASITIVDNGSSPPLIELAPDLKNHDGIDILESKENVGFARGMNLAITAERLKNTDAVWLLNNDTVVDKKALSELINYKKDNPKKICVGSVIINGHTKKIETVGGYRYLSLLGVEYPVGRGSLPERVGSNEPILDYISGAALFIDAPTLLQLGGLPSENFLYYEELNLARLLGDRSHLGVCLTAKVVHEKGRSTARLERHLPPYYSTLAALRYTKTVRTNAAIPLVLLLRLIIAVWRDLCSFSPHNVKGVVLATKKIMHRAAP